jgi:hypothetical protein
MPYRRLVNVPPGSVMRVGRPSTRVQQLHFPHAETNETIDGKSFPLGARIYATRHASPAGTARISRSRGRWTTPSTARESVDVVRAAHAGDGHPPIRSPRSPNAIRTTRDPCRRSGGSEIRERRVAVLTRLRLTIVGDEPPKTRPAPPPRSQQSRADGFSRSPGACSCCVTRGRSSSRS